MSDELFDNIETNRLITLKRKSKPSRNQFACFGVINDMLTVYDAVYLELAQRENIPLATLDGKLANAARAEKVRLIEDASL